MIRLADFTPARVALGLAGDSVPTEPLLSFRLAHARARDTVHAPLDTVSLAAEMTERGWKPTVLRTEAKTRDEYLRRPDYGRRLDATSAARLQNAAAISTAIVVADGLSAIAVHRHAVPLLARILPEIGTEEICIVQQGRVAVGDHIGGLLNASLSIVLLGERPGLSTPDSLGVYLTWEPRPGKTDAARNCVSNVHALGLSYEAAAQKILFLAGEARKRRLSGVQLKDSSGSPVGVAGSMKPPQNSSVLS